MAEQHTTYTWLLLGPARKEFIVPKLDLTSKLYTVKLRPGRGAEETLASTQGKAPSMVVDYTVFHNFSSIKKIIFCPHVFSIFQVIMLRNFTSKII